MNQYIADLSSLCHAEQLIMSEGKAKGMHVIDMYNGVLHLRLSADRALDIYQADYRGKNIVFKSKNGMVNAHLSSDAVRFVNDFGGGLLYTCGLDNIGSPKNGFVQHGSLAYLPANHVNIETGYDKKNTYYVEVSGDINYTALFGPSLVLKRKIRLYYNQAEIIISDRIVNQNYQLGQYMLMYHFNFGYPFIHQGSQIKINDVNQTELLNENQTLETCHYNELDSPQINKDEEVFIHTLTYQKTSVLIQNQEDRLSIVFDNPRLKYLTQWKSMASGDYALGIEPATCKLNEPSYIEIEAFEQHQYELKISIQSK